MSQCPHCRGLRKSRAAHVKCDCADKGHTQSECSHGESGNFSEPHDGFRHASQSDPGAVEHHSCCCTHGGRCGCALKKDHLDTVPEVDLPEPASAVPAELRKPRLSASQSDPALTVFTNGHHKPSHKHIDAARTAPYTIPRSHTVHGHGIGRRSVDSLPLTKRALLGHETPQHLESVTSAPQQSRLVKSEHGSPEFKPASNVEQLGNTIQPLDSYSPYEVESPNVLPPTFTERAQENYFAAPEFETPLHSGGLHAPIDWSAYGLSYDTGDYSSAAPSQPPSYASFEYSNFGHPGLTNSSSGEISEAGDYVPLPNPSPFEAENVEEPPQVEAYRLSSASSYLGMAPTNELASSGGDCLDIDDFLKNAEAQTTALERMNQTVPYESEGASAQHSLTVREAQNYAHMVDNDTAREPALMPATTSGVDPMWSNPIIDPDDSAMLPSEGEQMPTPTWAS